MKKNGFLAAVLTFKPVKFGNRKTLVVLSTINYLGYQRSATIGINEMKQPTGEKYVRIYSAKTLGAVWQQGVIPQ
ncbi:hypothetical protein J41TS4_41190 [Paenibacillus apis]|uniref:Uncharacterized protein n=1 Tax=Paenibacillus apis TaxID=1792174 RepID=A0A919Y3R0_9BACL|nr:hypothetical protein J41TS4_41190 [Paenibacillus apis]